jgi:hypothetical protein
MVDNVPGLEQGARKLPLATGSGDGRGKKQGMSGRGGERGRLMIPEIPEIPENSQIRQ